MASSDAMVDLLRQFSSKIRTVYDFHIKGDIPSKKIDNAIKTFANGLDRTTIIGFYDTTLTNSGKEGYLQGDSK